MDFAWTARLRARWLALREVIESNPRRVAGGVGAALLLCSATAFGLAAYGPQPELPPTQTLSIPLSIDVSSQVAALDAAPQTVYTSATVRGADSVLSLLHRLGVTDPAQLDALARDARMSELAASRDEVVTARVDGLGRLLLLQARLPGGATATTWRELTVAAGADGHLASTVGTETAQPQLRVASGVVRTTLFAATDAAGLPAPVAAQLVDLFSGELDFRRDLRAGTTFTVAYQVWVANGHSVRDGRILAVRISDGDKTHEAVWFQPKGGRGGYFRPDGGSLARAFLLSPLPYDRLTSGWGWRTSPIFNRPEFHKGIDLAIPVGTPVRTIADGRVSFAGVGTGYGKYVRVEHPGGFATIYSHLSRIEVHVGQKVVQGQVVALSGNSGWSTGPHLYYQFFVHGKPVNPLDIAHYSPKGASVPASQRAEFLARAATAREMLALVPGDQATRVASAD